jgi:tetratricopeptide (TPR) repeat protein
LNREYLEAQRFDELEELYKQLLDRLDLTAHEILFVNYNLGLLHHQLGHTQKAGQFWQKALSTIDRLGDSASERGLVVAAMMNLGTLHIVNGAPDKGLVHLKKAAEMAPSDGEIRFNLASALASMGEYVEALKEFKAAEMMGITSSQQPIEKLVKIIEESEKKNP